VRPSSPFPPLLLGIAALAAIGGCQSYQRQPLDLDAHRRAWLQRSPDSPGVAEYARRLAAAAPESPPGFDPADGLSLPEAQAVALVFSADLRLARLRAGVAQASALNAGQWEDPVLGVGLTRIIQSTPHPWMYMSTIGLTIPISGRLTIQRELAAAGHNTELLRVYQAEWNTMTELRRAWVRWAASGERVRATADSLERLTEIVSIVAALEAAGEMPRIDAAMFRIELATARNDLVQLESARDEHELTLKRLMGLSPSAPVVLVSGLLAEPERPEIQQIREQWPARNPALGVARAEYEVAERALELEIRKQYPDLMIGPGYSREDGTDRALLDLSIPLPLLNRNRLAIATARAERDVARAGFETTFERLAADLEEAGIGLAAARAQREILLTQVVPLVNQQYADTRKVAELGEVNTLALLQSLLSQQQTEIKLIDAVLAERLAAIRIDEIAGPAQAVPELGATAPEVKNP